MRNLSLEVVTGMTGPGATSEMAGQGVEVMIAGDETRRPLNAETLGMTVHHDVMMGLVDRVVTGDDRWSGDERPPQGGRDGYREDRDRGSYPGGRDDKGSRWERGGGTYEGERWSRGADTGCDGGRTRVGGDFGSCGGDRDDFHRRDEMTEEMTEEMTKTLVTEDFGDRRLW